jgi:hypothetical protein
MLGSSKQYQQAIEETETTLKYIDRILDEERTSSAGKALMHTLILHLVSLEVEKAVFLYRAARDGCW